MWCIIDSPHTDGKENEKKEGEREGGEEGGNEVGMDKFTEILKAYSPGIDLKDRKHWSSSETGRHLQHGFG